MMTISRAAMFGNSGGWKRQLPVSRAMATPLLESVRESDYIEYFIFPDKFNDPALPEDQLKLFRETQLAHIRSVVDEFTAGHIWHKDSINLNIRDSSNAHLADESEVIDQALEGHVHGVTHFGDNVEDEWLVAAAVAAVTRALPGAVARVCDADGELLLVEAADALPSWAEPDVCTGRVFLCHGQVHLVPPHQAVTSIQEAVEMVRDVAVATLADDGIQKAVAERIQGFPAQALSAQHRSRVRVPAAVAALLAAHPRLIAPAVRAFCSRDPIDAKVVRAMRWFPPESSVWTLATFTRCLFAALSHAPFTPDRRTGWSLPPPADPDHGPAALGVKLACGFELLAAESHRGGGERDWLRYLDTLDKRGYFQGLLPGSEGHKERTTAAREYFSERRDVISSRPADDLATLLEPLDVDVATWRALEHSLPPSDDASWLSLSPSELDAMLESRYGAPGTTDPDVSERLTAFLKHVSEVDGAEFPPPAAPGPVAPPRRHRREPAAPAAVNADAINFDGEAFTCAVHNILDLVVPEDDWESEGSMSSYEGEAAMFDPAGAEISQLMADMDRDLAAAAAAQETDFADVEDFEPVDVDMKAVASVLQSYEAQLGGPGPAGNLLGPMGVRPPAPAP